MSYCALHQKLLDVQEAAATILSRDPYFAGIDIITELKGDVASKIKAALQKLSLSVLVKIGDIRVVKRQDSRKIISVTIIIETAEVAITNVDASGARKSAISAAIAAMDALDFAVTGLRSTAPDTELDRFDVADDAIIQPDPERLVYQTAVTTQLSLTTKR